MIRAKKFFTKKIFQEDLLVKNLSFGKKYSELVRTKDFPDHLFSASDFNIDVVRLIGPGSDKFVTEDDAGISFKRSGHITIEPTTQLYQFLSVGEIADIYVYFSVSDPNGFSDQGFVHFRVAGINDSPREIDFSSLSIDEGIESQSVFADLTSIDSDLNDKHSYSLVKGRKSADNSEFTIDGDQLRIIESPDFEKKSSYSIRIQSRDVGGLTHRQSFMLSINDINEDPIQLEISNSALDENIADASTIATLSTEDPDSGDTHTYSLVSGIGDTHNSAFTIDGDQLKINASPDYETQDSYSVRLQTEDSGGLTFEKSFILTVNNLEKGWIQITEQLKILKLNLNPKITINSTTYSQAILGTSRKDKIKGTSSDEIIAGGATKDQLKGGSGADAFVFNTPGGFGNKQMDVITDFSYNDDDTLVLSKDQFSSFTRLSFQSAKNGKQLKKLSSSSDTIILYLQKSGKLYYNENGSEDGFGNGGVFAKLKGAPDLDGGDFTIV